MSARASLGARRTRAVLEAPVDAPDETGALVRTWTFVAHVWIGVVPRRGAETFEAGAQQTAIAHDVTLRWRADVSPPMRFRIGARTLHVRAALDPDARRRTLVCRCEEYVA